MSTSSTIRALAVALGVSGLANCASYTPGAKSHWDARVKELCEKDGGIMVYERARINRSDFRPPIVSAGILPLPPDESAASTTPYVSRRVNVTLNASSPRVERSETQVIRRSDGKVLGRSVQYWRRGGDVPTGIAEDSSFICPAHADLSSQVFVLE